MNNSYPVTGTLISASAGTGKTYQLALRFVALLCLGVDPTSIVALTFTRKAAGEFRDRILSRLAEGASSPEGAVNLANAVLDLWRGKNGIPALLPEGKNIDDMIAGTPMKSAANRQHFFCQLLKEMVGCFSRLQLCTMDSFFTKLVNLHATELGIGAPGIITEGAEREARELAIRDLCRRIETGDDDSIRDFWEDYDTAVSSTKTDTVAELRELIAKYHGIYLQNKDDEPWKQPLPDIPENEIRPLHPKEINSVEEKIAALCADKEMRLGLKPDQIRNITMKVRNADFSSREKIMEAINARANQDQPLAQMARELFHRERLDSLYHVRRGTCAVFALMKRFEECYEREVRSRGLFSNDDYTRKAMQLINRNEAANDLTFRLDGEIKHWMLDEFQDTSRMQWMTLKPLLENNVANCGDVDRSIFIVGDDKQSIYGWRNATPEIFQSLQTDNSELGQHLRKAQLTVNRRSVQEVLDFANHVFSREEDRSQWPPAEAYNKSEHGYVSMKRLPSGGGMEDMDEAISEIIGELPIRNKRMSIGILCRDNSTCEEIYQLLRSRYPELPTILINDIPIGTDSPLGQTLRALFKWLAHPIDTYCRSVVAASPLKAYAEGERRDLLLHMIEEQGVASLLTDIEQHLRSQGTVLSDFHSERLRDWMTAAGQFDAAGGGTLDDWLRFIEEQKRKENPPRGCVQISTMHKSKGLEYDAVILPYKSGDPGFDILSGEQPSITQNKIAVITRRAENTPESGLSNLLLPLSRRSERGSSSSASKKEPRLLFCEASRELQKMRETEEDKIITDSKNLLYVSLTRARYATYILLKDSSAKVREKDTGVVEAMYETPGGNPRWYEEIDFEERLETASSERGPLPKGVQRRKRCMPSAHEEEPKHRRNRGHGVDRTEALAFGTRVHACMEQVLCWEGETAAPAWYREPGDEAEQAAARALQTPAIRAFFELTPGDCAFNEQPLESVTDREWTSGVIDRFVVRADGRVQIIDYKTDADPSGLDRYREQMNCYRRMLASALNRPESDVSVTLISIPRTGEPSIIPLIE